MAKSTASSQGSGAGPTQPAIAVEEQLRQRTAELETALREAERINQLLRESEAQFRCMAHNSLLGITIIVDGKCTYTNPVQNETYGYSAGEMLLLDPLATVAPSDRAFASEKLRQALASEIERAELTLRAQRKDGTQLAIELSGSATLVNGKRSLILLTRNITARTTAERRWRESEQRLSSILDNVELISIMLDREARLTYCNDYLLRISGWQREEIIGRHWEDVFRSPRTVEQMHISFSDRLADPPSAWHHQNQMMMRNGECRTIFWNNTALRSPDGDIIGAASVGQDITEREVAEKKLRLFRTLIDHSNDAIEVVDVQTQRVIDVNHRACRALGYSREELLSLSLFDIDANDPARIPDMVKRLEQDGFVVIESLHRRKDRSVFPVELSLRMVVLDKPYIVSVARDITKRKQAEQEVQALQQLLREQAVHDPLTGLYNRRYLEEVLARELIIAERKGHCVSAIMCDLDHFKLVNDHYGHRAGDEALRTFGKLLKTCSRGSDVDCRYGGEEFLLLLPDMNEQSAGERAETLRVALASTPVQFEGSVIPVTGSFGVACFPKHARTGDSLIAAADKALYAAKEAGRNRVEIYAAPDAGTQPEQDP